MTFANSLYLDQAGQNRPDLNINLFDGLPEKVDFDKKISTQQKACLFPSRQSKFENETPVPSLLFVLMQWYFYPISTQNSQKAVLLSF